MRTPAYYDATILIGPEPKANVSRVPSLLT
jgi:hypothetical protein